MKICALAVVLAYFCQISDAYVFTEKPNQVIWGIEGDPLELNCAVDESWQVFFCIFWLISMTNFTYLLNECYSYFAKHLFRYIWGQD